MFTEVANELVANGIDQRTIIRDLDGYDAPVTKEFLKEVWKTIQFTMFHTQSTTELTTAQVDQVLDVFTKFIGEKYGITVQFPSIEAMVAEMVE